MKLRALTLSALACLLAARADEGMWTLDNLPTKQLQEKFGFTPTQEWVDHLRLSSLHWGGASGSFISADGLVLTNHHVGRGSVARVSTKENDYLTKGFMAKTRAEELKIPGLTVRTLIHMENVTDKVAAAVKAGLSEKDAQKAREKVIEELTADAKKRTNLQCQPVSFYEGGETWIYGYQVHDDLRLVAAPELEMAMFGQNFDNFTYLRHSLDFCIFRVYGKDGQPYKPKHFLSWASEPLKAGDLTFVSGHPGRTSRANTYAQMMFERDFGAPLTLKAQERQIATLKAYGAGSLEKAREVTTQRLGIENGWKAGFGYHLGLKNPAYMAEVKKREEALKAAVAMDPALKASAGQAWSKIEAAQKARLTWYKDAMFLGSAGGGVVGQGLALLRFVEESAKPAAKRSSGYETDEKLKAIRTRLEGGPAAAPVKEMNILLYATTLKVAQEELPAQHLILQTLLAGKTPEAAAKAMLEGSKLADPAVRKALLEGGAKALAESTDPAMIAARKLAPLAAKVRAAQETYTATLSEQASRIAKARFKVYGKNTFPDANSTLRLGFGTVSGYESGGTLLQPFTTFAGLYDRHWGWGGNAAKAEDGSWTLPQRWIDGRSKVELSRPLNFVHSVDTIGGNSGSPIVNRKGELVGLLFDGNYEGLPSRYYYDVKLNRSVSVDARGIVEALSTVMDGGHIAKEILGQ